MEKLFKQYLFLAWGLLIGGLLFQNKLNSSILLVMMMLVTTFYTIKWFYLKNKFRQENSENLLDLSEEVSFKAQQLIWLIKENNTEAENLVDLFADIAAASEDNAASVEEVSASIEELSTSSEVINQKANSLEEICAEALTHSKKNKEWITEAGETLLDISENVQKTSKSITGLKEVSQDIEDLLKNIQEITDQINLLALNASIEAARAGKAGQGFTVVAEEIKSLSEETDDLTNQIKGTIAEINSEVDNTSDTIKEGVSKIADVEDIAEKSITSFDTITNNLEEIMSLSSELADQTESQASATTESTVAINSITQESMTISDKLQETNSIIKKQSKNSSQILDYSQHLNQIGYDLHKRSVSQKDKNTLVFGVNPFTRPQEVKELYLPILEKVSQNIGKKAKTIIVSDYEALIKYTEDQLVDFGWFSPMAYVEATDKTNITPLVTPVSNGQPSYKGYIFTQNDRGYNQLKDVKGATVGFVDPLSASGYIYPKHLLKEQGINLKADLKGVHFLGNHDQVINAVLEGKVDIGATYDEAWMRAKEAGVNINKLKIIKETEAIPKDVIAARPQLATGLLTKVEKEFIKLGKQTELEELDQAGIDGFVKSDDATFDVVRRYSSN